MNVHALDDGVFFSTVVSGRRATSVVCRGCSQAGQVDMIQRLGQHTTKLSPKRPSGGPKPRRVVRKGRSIDPRQRELSPLAPDSAGTRWQDPAPPGLRDHQLDAAGNPFA